MCDVRLTVVNDRYFAVRIDATTDATEIDWRVDYDALHQTPVDTPDPIRNAVRVLMRRLDLRFAALDFVVVPSGQWIFLEINPNGQWAWLEDITGLPIAAAVADSLAGPST